MADKVTDVTFESLIGEHVLSGVDFNTVKIPRNWPEGSFEDGNSISFELDGKVYTAIEDPEDGYRSSMESLQLVEGAVITNHFPPVKVIGRLKEDDKRWGHKNDTLQFILTTNGKVILEVGTDNTDDYYPWFVAFFDPTVMA